MSVEAKNKPELRLEVLARDASCPGSAERSISWAASDHKVGDTAGPAERTPVVGAPGVECPSDAERHDRCRGATPTLRGGVRRGRGVHVPAI
jgi:hypothetical protein